MHKPKLTVERLMDGGFAEAGCWQIDSNGLLEILALPAKTGVYAFAIDGVVQYVGLAASSLAKRLRFYARPGISQRTSLRLNQLIRDLCREGHKVDVLVAFPNNFEWGGFIVSGAEGLEAGLIQEFHLPWNIRGAGNKRASESKSPQVSSNTPQPRPSVSGGGYFVYENWSRDKAIVHRGDCSFCNGGNGLHGARTTNSSTWYGPYDTPQEALTKAKACRRGRTEGCAICGPL
jgi:hypothetical protein